MEIHTLWGRRRGAENDPIELIAAYDDYTVEMNEEIYEGFAQEVSTKDLVEHQIIVLNVDGIAIQEAFDRRPSVDVTVKEEDN